MQLDLSGRHALVCGASQGIGRACAIELALLGANVTVLARRAEVLAEVVGSLPRTDGAQHHDLLVADASDTGSLRERVEALVAAAPVHILVNNSGGPPPGSILDATPPQFLDAFGQHLLANHTLAQVVIPGMRDAGWGRIVNIISTSVKEPLSGIGVSNTTRGAVASWAKTLSRELGGDGITVNNVLPGYTRTQRLDQILADRSAATGKPQDEIAKGMLASVPVGRFADAGEIGGVFAFLCTQAAAYVNGQALAVDGGRMQSI